MHFKRSQTCVPIRLSYSSLWLSHRNLPIPKFQKVLNWFVTLANISNFSYIIFKIYVEFGSWLCAFTFPAALYHDKKNKKYYCFTSARSIAILLSYRELGFDRRITSAFENSNCLEAIKLWILDSVCSDRLG